MPRGIDRFVIAVGLVAALAASACSSFDPDVATPTTTTGTTATDEASPDDGAPSTTTSAGPADPADPGVAGADGLGDAYFPELGNGGYDVERYVLDVRFDPDIGILDATATIEATAVQRLDTFNLDFIGFEIETLTVDGDETPFSRSGAELTVDPAEPLPVDEPFVTEVVYRGEPSPVNDPSAPIVIGWLTIGDGSYVVSETSGSRGWFPANDHPADKALFRFVVTAPDDYKVAANGLLQDRTSEDGETTWVYEARDPIATYLSTIAIGPFVLTEEEGPDGVVIRNALHESLADAAAFDLGRTDEMLELFSDLFGPYPFEAYGVIAVDVPFGAALETQTYSVFSADLFTGTRRAESIVAHELAHQWFGDYVGLEQWSDNWLKEGAATYAEMLWAEHITPGYDIDADAARRASRDLPPPGDPGPAQLYGAGPYQRGGLTFHALRRTVGDDVFFDILRTYVERFGNATASADDFITLAEDVAGADLAAFFDAWLYDEDVPALPR